ncbi:hypothetical protein BKA63DRAFT_97450 [Paraphoma chrysanthemicola]|nr:hypothetical protein BKA63DRAFT_97450 [Paraphoma chrysanthemicola]
MIQLMDMIYTAASLTICAAEGAAAHSGISGILAANRNSPQITVQYEKDVRLMASESAESYIARSVWNSRAWTFQERLCSNRSLVFAAGRAFFQCRTSSMREDIHMESTTSTEYDSGGSLELKDVPGRLFSENPVRQYTKCTELFTERKMAYDKDKLKAFSAIQSILSTNMNSDFHFALPTAYFDFALLWIPLTPTRRLPDFPSWSWCGWGAKMEYKYQTLEGVFANLYEWCNTRTWITWYRKASQSDRFEYVWDGRRGGLPGRWSGYTVQQKGWSRKHPWDQRPRQGKMSYGPRFKSLNVPEFLFFRTHSGYFSIDPTPQSSPSSQLDSMSHTSLRNDQPKPGVNWHNLSDCNGDWCGTVLLAAETTSAISLEASEFIAISEARDFSLEEHDSWTFYVAKDRVDSQWDLYYVLLITTNEKGVSRRIGIGKIFKDAFKRSLAPGSSWKEIVLG